MHRIVIEDFIKLYQFSTALRQRVFLVLLELARKRNLTALIAWLAAASEHEKSTLDLERAWRRARNYRKSYGPELAELDREADAVLGALSRLLKSFEELHKDDDAVLSGLRGLRSVLFPDGLKAMIHQPVPEQHALVVRALEELRQPAHAATIQRFHLAPYLSRLEALCGDMHSAIEVATMPFSRLAEARKRGQHNLLATVGKIIGDYPEEDADEDERSSLLRVIAQYNQRIGERLRRGKRPLDPEDDLSEPQAA